MTSSPARRGRPKSAEKKRAYQVKLPLSEADAFDAYVRRRSQEATGDPEELGAAPVLRMIIRAAVEGEAPAPPLSPTKPSPKPKRGAR